MTFDMAKPNEQTTVITLHDTTVARDELAYYLLMIYSLDPEAARGALSKIKSDAITELEERMKKEDKEQGYRLVTNDKFSGLTPRELLQKAGVKGLSYLRTYATEHREAMGRRAMDEIGRAYTEYVQRLPEIVDRMRMPVEFCDFLEDLSQVYKIPVDPTELLRKGQQHDDYEPLKKAAMDVARMIADKNKA